VQPRKTISLQADSASQAAILPQDPSRTPTDYSHNPLVLPLTVLPKSRRPKGTAPARAIEVIDIDDDSMSVATLDEDTLALEEPAMPLPIIPAKRQADPTVMPFKPVEPRGLPLTDPPTYASAMTTRRLQKDFQALLATQEVHERTDRLSELGWYVDPAQFVDTANLYQWIIELHSFDLQLPLSKDMQAAKAQSVVLEMRFHSTYPMASTACLCDQTHTNTNQGPPFVRVIRPRFLPFQQGGGGHVTAGGSICMDLLTNSGWSAVSTIESVLLQIRMAISSTDPRPARLENPRGGPGNRDYGVGEAVEAFKRACAAHGWEVPKELNAVAAVEGRLQR
jgi:ubiquitin-conjugating enzyme E2 Q